MYFSCIFIFRSIKCKNNRPHTVLDLSGESLENTEAMNTYRFVRHLKMSLKFAACLEIHPNNCGKTSISTSKISVLKSGNSKN